MVLHFRYVYFHVIFRVHRFWYADDTYHEKWRPLPVAFAQCSAYTKWHVAGKSIHIYVPAIECPISQLVKTVIV